jgi:hypothetical protein
MTELDIAGYIDRGLGAQRRDDIEDHLAVCAECRQNLAESQRLVNRVRRPRRIAAAGGLIGLAAVALIFVRAPLSKTSNLPQERVMREATPSTKIPAYAPIGTISQQNVRFIWGTAPRASAYRITLSSTDGTTVWSATVRDTSALLPDSVALQPDAAYVWFVDATLSDGSTRSTTLQQIQVNRETK